MVDRFVGVGVISFGDVVVFEVKDGDKVIRSDFEYRKFFRIV